MGTAVLNIYRCIMNSFLDGPPEINEGTGTSKNKPQDADRLQAFNQNQNVDSVTANLIDGMPMVKALISAFLDEWLKEAK